MKELDLKPKFQSLQAWNWASATVRTLWLHDSWLLSGFCKHTTASNSFFFLCLKISSRTLHIPWDSAGCLCPVGDLFNYDAPGDDSNTSGGPETVNNAEEAGHVVETQSERLTDGGFDGEANAYCLYARRNYQLGEQVQVLNYPLLQL